MRDDDPREVTLNLNIAGEYHIHFHYNHSSPQPGAADIINSIRDVKEKIMSELDKIVATEGTDTQTLLARTDALISAFQALGSGNNTTLQAALDAANLDQSQQAAILKANDDAINAEIAKVNAAVPPAGGGATLSLASAILPDAVTGQAGYTAALSFSGGTAPYTVTNAPLNDNGFTIDADGNVSGQGGVDGTSSFPVSFRDSAGNTGAGVVTLVSAAAVQQV